MTGLFAALFVLALVAAFVAFMLARRQHAKTGLPFGARIVYTDTGAWVQVEKPLFAQRYALTGKPDYIVKQNGVLIPVEVKPHRRADVPYASDVLQLAAYGLLIHEEYHIAPPHGLLKYRDAVFQVDFTDALRKELLATLERMRKEFDARDVPRSHAESARCRACGFRQACGQVLE